MAKRILTLFMVVLLVFAVAACTTVDTTTASTTATTIKTTAKRTRATYLNKCSKIDKLVDELYKEDVISNIKKYDQKAKTDSEKISIQLDKLIAKLQELNNKLKG